MKGSHIFFSSLEWNNNFRSYIIGLLRGVWLLLIIKMAVTRNRGIEDYICFGQPTDALIPDPEDCGAYFICDGGLGIRNHCHQGIYFNPILAQCDVDYKDCNATAGPEEQPTTSSPQTTGTGTSSTFFPPITIVPENNNSQTDDAIADTCPSNDTPDLTFLRSYEYCDRYFLCYYGKPIMFDCAGGYYWSQIKKACVLPQESECQVRTLNNTLISMESNLISMTSIY